MKDVWPVFENYKIDNIDTLAKHCLESLEIQPVHQQLKIQKIVMIERKPILYSGAMGLQDKMDPYSGFRILLNDTNTSEEDVESIGHELGHTFEVCYDGSYFTASKHDLFLVRPEFLDISEGFARAFEKLWLERKNNREQALELLRLNQLPMII